MRWLDDITVNGHEFEQAPGDGEGQGSLVCCSPWGRKESDASERLNGNRKAGRFGSHAFWVPEPHMLGARSLWWPKE